MLSYYAKRSKGEGFYTTTTPREYTTWVHGDAVTQDELNKLATRYNLTANIIRDVRDANELPRIEYSADGHLYLFLRVPRMCKSGEVTTSPLLTIVRGGLFFTLAKESSFRPEKIIKKDYTRFVTTSTHLALLTIAAVVTEYETLIRKTTNRIHDISQRLKTHEVTNRDFIYFVTIEDNLNEYVMNLDGMQMLARHLYEDRHGAFTVGNKEMIDDILLHMQQLSVTVASQRQSITSIRDAYSTVSNNSLNQRMKTLTVLTVLIALPNVFYGMYGMNVALPFADEPWAYAAVVLFTFVIIFVVYGLAKRFRVF